ncbi:MAG: alpha/beta fold hydrolase [Deltaproteobacteria bacterium]|nr:alpha/beta fold hydrolase [Deltaproteobacteria bacterium]
MMKYFVLILICFLLIPLFSFILRSFYRLEIPAPERYDVATDDGWILPLYHYPTEGEPKGTVILCHGLGANRFNLDLDEKYSLARFLWRSGYEAWVVERRGAGNSHRVGGGKAPYNWTFDDYVFQDLPAVLHFVSEHAQSSDLVWIGHSLGGMAIYAYLSTHSAPFSLRIVTAGSPARFDYLHDFFELRPEARKLAQNFVKGPWDALYVETLSRWFFPFLLLIPPNTWFAHLMLNPDNVTRQMVWYALANVPSPVTTAEFEQWLDWIDSKDFRRVDRQWSYQKNLYRIEAPALIIAGNVDHLAPTEAVLYAYEHLGSSEKVFREFSRANGDSIDYGHSDLLVGESAPKEVFPFILNWLEETRPR